MIQYEDEEPQVEMPGIFAFCPQTIDGFSFDTRWNEHGIANPIRECYGSITMRLLNLDALVNFDNHEGSSVV